MAALTFMLKPQLHVQEVAVQVTGKAIADTQHSGYAVFLLPRPIGCVSQPFIGNLRMRKEGRLYICLNGRLRQGATHGDNTEKAIIPMGIPL